MKRRSIMKKPYFAILFMLVPIMSSCVTYDEDGCRSERAILKGQDHGKVGDGTRPSFININPDTVTVSANCTFLIVNKTGTEVHTTSTEAWLTHPPTAGNLIMGPAQGNSGDEFKYTVHVKDIGQLDPRGRLR
jgi:hypothetical protein